MLTQIVLRAGSHAGAAPLRFVPGAVTVFIGPNNSGKSQALRDISRLAKERRAEGGPVVESIAVPTFSTPSELMSLLSGHKHHEDAEKLYFVKPPPEVGFLNVKREQIDRDYGNPSWTAKILGQVHVVRLDGSTRLNLLNEVDLGDLQQPPHNHLAALFRDDSARANLREAVFEAFREYVVLDPTNPGHIRVRLSKTPPRDPQEEQGLNAASRRFHSLATPIAEYSDGVCAFTGLLAAVLSSQFRVMLIDEPEAFLHPSLAKRLGQRLAFLAKLRSANVLAATHSAHFLMGCIESGVQAQVIRLTYQDGVATARQLRATDLEVMMRDPLLRSSSALSGLFHDGVCVGESDTDRAFYDEISHRLGTDGARNTLFLNAQNKQTVARLIEPLRKMGVPAAAIVDIDVIKSGGKEWTDLLSAAQVPVAVHAPWSAIRASLVTAFTKSGKDMKRDGGVAILKATDADAARVLFDDLEHFGIFVVREGEVESWLKSLGATGHGPPWLVRLFEAMGSDPDAAGYQKPGSGDVWDFVRRIARWIANPARRGIG